MRKKPYSLLVFLCVLAGCGFFAKKEAAKVLLPAVKKEQNPSPRYHLVDAQRLKQGGELLIVPFVADERVAASDDMERVALTIVKEIYQILSRSQSSYSILSAADAHNAQVLLEGRVTQMETRGRVKQWVGLPPHKMIAVKGKILDVDSDRVILEFSHKQESKNSKENYLDLASKIGQDIGQMLLCNIQENCAQ